MNNNNVSFNLQRTRSRAPIYNLTLLSTINARRLKYLACEERKKEVNMIDLKKKIDSILEKLTQVSYYYYY